MDASTHWLQALQALHSGARPAVLVTVAGSQGSTPRAAGARMVFTHDQQFDTIGGGHLEWRAAQIARAMLAADASSWPARCRLERIALGPSLGQCCGGVVQLAFERFDATDTRELHHTNLLRQLAQYWQQGRALWRVVALDSGILDAPATVLLGDDGAPLDSGLQIAGLAQVLALHERGTHVVTDRNGLRWLVDRCHVQRPQVVLFGAGHVGTAIMRVLSTLPCRVLWVDEREDMFPPALPPQVSIEATDAPNAVVDQADPGAYFLVMTHSHALDQQLSERILKRSDIGWFGLIGSHTKRKQFEHRLLQRGITPEQLNQMTCPIGIPGIYGKEPASIAIAVVAQLLQLWELHAEKQGKSAARPQLDKSLATQVPDGRN